LLVEITYFFDIRWMLKSPYFFGSVPCFGFLVCCFRLILFSGKVEMSHLSKAEMSPYLNKKFSQWLQHLHLPHPTMLMGFYYTPIHKFRFKIGSLDERFENGHSFVFRRPTIELLVNRNPYNKKRWQVSPR
jgi:hypothetical protein